LNLFLALLLSSFGAESLSSVAPEEAEVNKLQEAADRISRFTIFVKSHFHYCVRVKIPRILIAIAKRREESRRKGERGGDFAIEGGDGGYPKVNGRARKGETLPDEAHSPNQLAIGIYTRQQNVM